MKKPKAPNSAGRAPTRSTTKPAVACPVPDTTKKTVIRNPSWAKLRPNSFMNCS